MKLYSVSLSWLSCSVKMEQINSKIVCLTHYIIRLILYTEHVIHQKDNINMDCREMECEDVKWIQLMQPRSVANMLLESTKLLDCMYYVREYWRQKESVMF